MLLRCQESARANTYEASRRCQADEDTQQKIPPTVTDVGAPNRPRGRITIYGEKPRGGKSTHKTCTGTFPSHEARGVKTAHLRRTVRICRAGLHLSLRISKQMRPSCMCTFTRGRWAQYRDAGAAQLIVRLKCRSAQAQRRGTRALTLSIFGW